VVNNVRFLRRWIDQESALKVVTSQYFGLAYYASPIWMTPDIPHHSWKKLNSLHYRAKRAAVKDPKQKISRQILDVVSKRPTPAQWARYSTAWTAISLINGATTRLADELRQKMYINDRMPMKSRFFNSARTKIGRQCFSNRLDCINVLNFNWLGNYSKDYIRVNLKRQFFQTWQTILALIDDYNCLILTTLYLLLSSTIVIYDYKCDLQTSLSKSLS